MNDVPDIHRRDAPRVTPWELIFGAPVFDAGRFGEIRSQAESMGARTVAELFMLPAAGELLHSLTPPEGGREAVEQVRALIFAAYRFWQQGCNVYRLPEALLRDLLTQGAGGAPTSRHTITQHSDAVPASFRPPLAAGYAQLPRNVVWARIADGGAAEPVDGFFWSLPDDEPEGALDLLFALGIRPGRPGLSTFDLRLESVEQLHSWGTTMARPEGDDFANVLPGGELQGYLSITTGAEALKLAALCLGGIAHAGSWDAEQVAGQRIHVPADG